MSSEILDRLAVRELTESWYVHRDNRDWDMFLMVCHEDGVMMTTWGGQTTPRGFAEAAQRGYERGENAVLPRSSYGAIARSLRPRRAAWSGGRYARRSAFSAATSARRNGRAARRDRPD